MAPLRYYRAVALGKVLIPGNVFLAPIAGYTDAAYRSVCFSEGADLCYTEMVSSEALIRGHPATRALLERDEAEAQYAIQLFGSRPEALAEAAAALIPYRPLVVDLNCGCPVPKIVKAGAGSALLRDPERVRALVAAMCAVLEPVGIPVTAKIRSGWDAGSINYLETGSAAVEGGARAVTLHARTRAQGYTGRADWSHIARLAENLPVPVFGSGDVVSGQTAKAMLAETGAAGVMIARGAMGNPFIFREIRAVLENRDFSQPELRERISAARRHLDLACRFLGERRACVEFRKQFCSYTKGSIQGAFLRSEAVRATTREEFEALFRRWLAAGGDRS